MEEPGCPRFVLTGSSSRQLKRAGVDLLAGRATLRTMHPFMAAELGRAFDFDSAIETGLLPLIWDARDPVDTLGAYVGLYVQQEVQSEGIVRNVGAFHRFLEAISFSQGSALNVSEVARECSVSRKTVEGFVGIAEDLLLAFRVPVYPRRGDHGSESRFFATTSRVKESYSVLWTPKGPRSALEDSCATLKAW